MAEPQTAIAEQLAEAERRLTEAKASRAVAILDGGKVAHRPVLDAEAEIEALTEAAQLELSRQRESAALARAEARKAALAQLHEREAGRLEAVAAAETAARDLVAALNDALAAARDEVVLFRQVGARIPLPISTGEPARRLGQRLAAVLSGIDGHPKDLGAVRWASTWRKSTDNWQALEAAELAGALDAITMKDSIQ